MVDPPYRVKNMMPGMIMLWYGSIASIPSGWTLCDGSMGTPDLRDRFVMAAGVTYGPNVTGGTAGHQHTFTGDGHSHPTLGPLVLAAGTDFAVRAGVAPAVGTNQYHYFMPKFHALCYIMKL